MYFGKAGRRGRMLDFRMACPALDTYFWRWPLLTPEHNRSGSIARIILRYQLDNLLALSRRPYSLFEGLGVLVRLLIDLGSNSVTQFPLYNETAQQALQY